VLATAAVLAGCSRGDGGGEDSGETSSDGGASTTEQAAVDVDRLLAPVGDEAVAQLDERYQSYNIEMVEVTGGNFWPPYEAGGAKVYRPPIDLESERLRNLARALGPAYIRVSGTWANSTYFDAEGTSGGVAPPGFQGVLTADQWSGVGDFADAVDAEVVTSFASNTGVRDANGVWLDDQARALMRYSVDNGIPLVAAEFYNEPSLNIGVPAGYDVASFVRDFATFESAVEEEAPDLQIVGPGAVDDVTPLVLEPPLRSPEILDRISPTFDKFSYHFYPKVSERCGSTEGSDIALTEEFLGRVEIDQSYYEDLRDTYEPDAPMWITETAQAACGGDRWSATYRDVIRYVDTLGRLADGDGDVVFHNTLAASDYGLIDEDGFEPRPNYWAAVLWGRLMGPTVLQADEAEPIAQLSTYAHCTPRAAEPSITYAVVNSSTTQARSVAPASGVATVYRLTGELDSSEISLNGAVLAVNDDGTSPPLEGEIVEGPIEVPPASVAYVVAPTDLDTCA
jgi:hypothetical protein